VTHALQRVEAILVFAGGDDLAVELGRGVEVVVVVVEACVLQLLGLAVLQHAQGGAGFQAQGLHFAHHVQHGFEVALLGATPGRAHAEARRAGGLGGPGGSQHVVEIEQALVFHAGVVTCRLRAIAAVFGTAAGLDRQQRRQLHAIGVEVFTMHRLRPIHQVGKRQGEQRLDVGHG